MSMHEELANATHERGEKVSSLPPIEGAIEKKSKLAAELRHYINEVEAPLREIPLSLLVAITEAHSSKDRVIKGLLGLMRETFVAPFAQSQDHQVYQVCSELSDLMSDADYARSILRLRKIEQDMQLEDTLKQKEQEENRKTSRSRQAFPENSTVERIGPGASEVVSPQVEALYNDFEANAILPPPVLDRDRYEHLNTLLGDQEQYLKSAEQAEEFFQRLVDSNEKVAIDQRLVENIVSLLEGGPQWVNELQVFADQLSQKMRKKDREEFLRLVHSYGYAKSMAIKGRAQGENDKMETARESSPRYRKAKRSDMDEEGSDDRVNSEPTFRQKIVRFFKRSA